MIMPVLGTSSAAISTFLKGFRWFTENSAVTTVFVVRKCLTPHFVARLQCYNLQIEKLAKSVILPQSEVIMSDLD